ncbi:MAG TPA: ATP-binding cassette domain-containing protein, partial [Elusimicrobiota bacterium]|nr:ATP-binding cassette domain-containing protein [Elusimicrobiota bacterium]
DRLLGEVSGGQRQRAVLAQALCQSPDVLVLDEPTKGLDVMAERDLLDLIAGLRSQRLTILLVSHSLQIPLNFTDRILLFAEGRVVDTTPGELTTTNRLEEIYGAPFAHLEQEGMKWAMPRRRPQ